jgi:predicted ATPase/class 3 adenylate cyclase
MAICASCGQDNPDIAKFCLACGSPLAPPVAPTEERKLVTVLFTDIVGSTATAEKLDPEDVRARLVPYYGRVRGELERFGGTVEKFIGDAVVALFGAPVAHEDDPERAVRAAFAIRDALEHLNAEDEWLDLRIRTGVTTGEALVVVGARASEGEGMAAGDVMNTAARIQSAAPVNGILVSDVTYRATRDAIVYRSAEPIVAKGKREAVAVWEAVEVGDGTADRARVRTKLVGRDTDVAALEEAWALTLHDRSAVFASVIGPPGIGKSRLLAEFTAGIADEANVHVCRCLSYGEGITYWPVTEAVKSAAGILQSDGSPAVATKLDALLDRFPTSDPDELRTIAAALSNLAGIPTTPRGTYAASEISQAELHWGIRRAFELLAQERPTVIVFEDLHWAEPTLLELVEYIASGDAQAPLLLIGSARPELADVAPGLARTSDRRRAIVLETLPPAAGTDLLATLLGDEALATTPFAQALIRNAGGNPLFIEETVRMLRDEGLVDPERWQQAEPGDELPVPATLQALIGSRLDGLDAAEKRLAHHAAVVGAVFWASAVAHLGSTDGGPAGDVEPSLAMLAHRDFVQPNPASTIAGEDEYGFKHILIRDVAYGQVPKTRRIVLHVRFGDWITMFPASADEFVEIVAWHLEQACKLSREVARSPIEPPLLAAADALANAAGRAERREGYREAARFYRRALDVLGGQHVERALELRLRRAEALAELGEPKEACEELQSVIDTAASLGRNDVRCEALVALADVDQRQGRATEAHGRLAEAQTLAAEIGDANLEVKTAFILSALRADFAGEFEAAVEELHRALAIAEKIRDLALRVEGHLRIGFLLYNMGDLAGAERELIRCTSLARDLGSHRDEARATFQLALVKYYRGEVAEGEGLALQAHEWLERTGDSYLRVQNAHALARLALARGDAAAAQERLQEALPTALEIGGWLVVETYRLLTETYVRQRRLEDAQELVAFAARNLPEEDAFARAALLLAEATVATASNEQTTAATSFSEALRLLEELNMTIELAEARLALARSLRSFGDVTGAQTELERARTIFARVGAATPLAQIDDELAEVAKGPGAARPSA